MTALGDDRRSFSYYKAIPVIEKLPFKIESADQVKHLPGIGKSLQDHVNKCSLSSVYFLVLGTSALLERKLLPFFFYVIS